PPRSRRSPVRVPAGRRRRAARGGVARRVAVDPGLGAGPRRAPPPPRPLALDRGRLRGSRALPPRIPPRRAVHVGKSSAAPPGIDRRDPGRTRLSGLRGGERQRRRLSGGVLVQGLLTGIAQ